MSTSQCHPQLAQQQAPVQRQALVQQQAPVHQQDSAQGGDSQQSCLSSRKKRRIEQSQRANGKKTRGQTRAVKWNDERAHRLGINPSFTITGDIKRIVGKNADQFITEVGSWIRTMLPLDCRWKDMASDKKQRLLNMIKAKWNMPEGDHVVEAVVNQCQTLYRQWRYRLKEKYFDGFSIAEAVKNHPEDVHPDEWKWLVEKYWGSEQQKCISNANRRNRSKQKVKGIQGSKSTARILDMMRKNPYAGNSSQPSEQVNENIEEGTQASQDATVGSIEVPPLPPPEPEYIRLWEKTKRHKDNSRDTVAEQRLQDFKELRR